MSLAQVSPIAAQMNADETDFFAFGLRAARDNRSGWRDEVQHRKATMQREAPIRVQDDQVRGWMAQQEEERLRGLLEHAMPLEVLLNARKFGFFFLFLAAFLTAGSYFLTVLVFEPFQVGPVKTNAIALGATLTLITATELFFRAYKHTWWMVFSVASSVLTIALGYSVFLALVRAGLFASLVQLAAPVITVEGAATATGSHPFYDQALQLLKIALPMLTLALEMVAGTALHVGLELTFPHDLRIYRAWYRARDEVARIHADQAYQPARPDIFEEKATEGGLRGEQIHVHPERAVAIAIPIVLALLMLLALLVTNAGAAESPLKNVDSFILLLDMSKSQGVIGGDGASEFEKNRLAAETLLHRFAGPGVTITVLGITSDSFGRSRRLLHATVDRDPGYFGERLAAAQKALASEWRVRTAHIVPDQPQSDIVGALALVGQLLLTEPNRRTVLVMMSDMRQASRGLNLERPDRIDVPRSIAQAKQLGLIHALPGLPVYVLGVHGANKSLSYFDDLRRFWEAFFTEARAQLRAFTTQRELAP